MKKTKQNMTAREWLTTPEGEKYAEEQAQKILDNFAPDIERAGKYIAEVQAAMAQAVSGLDMSQLSAAFSEVNRAAESLKHAHEPMPVPIPIIRRREVTKEEIESIVQGALRVRNAKPSKPPFLEYKDNDFYTYGRLIDFPNPKASYIFMLKALFLKADASGFLSYEEINRHLEHEGKMSKIKSIDGKRFRVSNAFVNLYRPRKRQKVPFPSEHPNGAEVIRVIPAEGLRITIK